ncbi:MAG: YdcF family protein [Rugosibacter sp.]
MGYVALQQREAAMWLDVFFVIKKILSVILLPPLLPLLVIIVGLFFARWRPRAGKVVTWTGVLLSLGLMMPAGVDLFSAPLEAIPVVQPKALQQAQAIVILGGGQRLNAKEYGGAAPNRLTLERLRYGAHLARQSGLPVLVTGGALNGMVAEAVVMAKSLREDFGVTPQWIEARSLDTQGNAYYSAQMLRPREGARDVKGAKDMKRGIRRIVLVTHAAHMRRSVNEFTAQGFEVVPAPTAFYAQGKGDTVLGDFFPGANAAYAGWYALHEWLGILSQHLRDSGFDPFKLSGQVLYNGASVGEKVGVVEKSGLRIIKTNGA